MTAASTSDPSMLDQLTILSPGLLGGSVAQGARERRLAKRIVIWARREETRTAIAAKPWCDAVEATPEAAAAKASLVVIASPVDAIVPLLRQIAASLPEGSVVTDVGSVKAVIAREGHAAVGSKAHFVGSHPMAGSEKTGWENGTPALFQGRTCFVTPLAESDPASVRAVSAFWEGLGGRVASVPPETHDAIVAHISHLPQLVASALCAFLARKDPKWRDFAGGGLRDTTRIAGSDPALWRAILRANQDRVREALRGFAAEIASAEKALEAGDWEKVADLIARGKSYREGFPKT